MGTSASSELLGASQGGVPDAKGDHHHGSSHHRIQHAVNTQKDGDLKSCVVPVPSGTKLLDETSTTLSGTHSLKPVYF